MLLASFDRLLLIDGFENVSIRKLTANANVGRSTFYEHFEGKHDLLGQSVARMLEEIANVVASSKTSNALLDVMTHVQAQHALAGALLHGSTRPILVSVLALKLERQLVFLARRSATPPRASLSLLAKLLAQVQLGAIDAWLSSDDSCDVHTAAQVLHATTRAVVAAMFDPSG